MKLKLLKKYLKEKLQQAHASKEHAQRELTKYAILLNELDTIEELKCN